MNRSGSSSVTERKPGVNPPLWLLAELTYRCPLQCPYCSNPLDFAQQEKELTTEQWIDVFRRARYGQRADWFFRRRAAGAQRSA